MLLSELLKKVKITNLEFVTERKTVTLLYEPITGGTLDGDVEQIIWSGNTAMICVDPLPTTSAGEREGGDEE